MRPKVDSRAQPGLPQRAPIPVEEYRPPFKSTVVRYAGKDEHGVTWVRLERYDGRAEEIPADPRACAYRRTCAGRLGVGCQCRALKKEALEGVKKERAKISGKNIGARE